MAGHPASATQPTSSPRALQRNDNNRPDALTAPITRPPSTSSSDTWCGAVREDRVRSATKAKTQSSSLKTKRKSKPQRRSKCYTPSRAEKRYRTSARDRSIIHQIDVVLSSTTPEDPIPTPTSVLNTSNLRRQQSYDPIQRFCDSKDDETFWVWCRKVPYSPRTGRTDLGHGRDPYRRGHPLDTLELRKSGR